MSKPQDFVETINDLDAGVFAEKINRGMSEAALAAVYHGDKGKKAKVTLEFTLERIGDSRQLQITHKITKSVPTPRGRASEDDATSTALYVGRSGALTITPDTQLDMIGRNEENA